jgi:hypothetical protein
MLFLYKEDLIIISLKINIFSPWYSWSIVELALSNNHSLTPFIYLFILIVIILFIISVVDNK